MAPSRVRARLVRAVCAAATAASGFLVVAWALAPGSRWAPLGVDRAPITALSHVLAIALGVGLLFLARGLARGSRRAAQLTATVLAGSALWAALGGGPAPAAALEAVAATALIRARGVFPRGTASRPARAAGALAAGGLTASYATAFAAVLIADRATSVSGVAGQAAGWLVGGAWWLRSDSGLAIALDVAVGATLVAVAWMIHGLLRPGRALGGHSREEHERAAAIVAAHACDSLDPFALREDKAFHFAHGGLLAYRTVRETAVVSGDPIGPPGTAPRILASFESYAAAHGWDVVVTAASSRHLAGYRELGFRTLPIGEEAMVDPAALTLEGPEMKTVRKAVRRVARQGWTVRIVPGSALTPDAMAAIAALDRDWQAGRSRLQGFAMTLGRLWGAAEDQDALYVLGSDADGSLGAFLRFSRYPGGLSLDVMRRAGTEPNGVNEALIVAAVEHARDEGIGEVSLNFAGFSHLMVPRGPLTRRQRLARRALMLAHGRFQLDRLVRFNQKFLPSWEPRHLVYRGAAALPRAGLRVLQAEAYVRGPRQQPMRGAWRPQPEPLLDRPLAGALR
jgi:lysyl-tRNA synthetase class 2